MLTETDQVKPQSQNFQDSSTRTSREKKKKMVSMATRWRSQPRDQERPCSPKSRGPPPHQSSVVDNPPSRCEKIAPRVQREREKRKCNVRACRCLTSGGLSLQVSCSADPKRRGLDSRPAACRRYTGTLALSSQFFFTDSRLFI